MQGKAVRLALAISLLGVAPAAAQTPLPVPGPSLPTTQPSVPLPAPAAGPAFRSAPPPTDCTVEGTNGPDRLSGTAGSDVICGEGGDDVLEGFEGDDVLDGGDGVDTATWESSSCCVRANLDARVATGGLGTDQLVAIENLSGSQGADVLRGDANANNLSGNGSTDLLFGGEGDDALLGGEGDDWLAGEGGANLLDGGTGANVCVDGSGTLCENRDPPDPSDTRGLLDIATVHAELGQDPTSWQVEVRSGARAARLWDEGYIVISFDTRGGEEFELHALVRFTKQKPIGLLIPEGRSRASGHATVRRAGSRGFVIRVPVGKLGLDPLRLYYRWTARTIFTGNGCKPCFDAVPDARAYPQALVTA